MMTHSRAIEPKGSAQFTRPNDPWPALWVSRFQRQREGGRRRNDPWLALWVSQFQRQREGGGVRCPASADFLEGPSIFFRAAIK